MTSYFLRRSDGREEGPLSASELKRIASNEFDGQDWFVRLDGKDRWYPAMQVKGLLPAISPVSSNLPSPTDSEVFLPDRLDAAEGEETVVEVEPVFEVDTEQIERAVLERKIEYVIQEEWRTPSGYVRRTPVYSTSIQNAHLGKQRIIRKSSRDELVTLANQQLQRWQDEEIKSRASEADAKATQALEKLAGIKDERARTDHRELGMILQHGLRLEAALNWSDYLDSRSFEPFRFAEEPPSFDEPPRPSLPQKNFLHKLMPSRWAKAVESHNQDVATWERDCQHLRKQWEEETESWKQQRTAAEQVYERRRGQFIARQQQRNAAVLNFQKHLADGDSNARTRYIQEVLDTRPYPAGLKLSHAIAYEALSQTLVVDVRLPSLDDFPRVIGYRFVKSQRAVVPIEAKVKERQELYDDALRQTVLRTLHHSLAASKPPWVTTVVVNGWVTYIDRSVGKQQTDCVISISATREEMNGIDLAHVSASECIKRLKGIVAGPMSQIAPVKPILQLNQVDRRFVESRDVIDDLDASTNLAEIGWEEFEHLVRELFQRMFEEHGADVKITQSSSDGGVDAVVFDPDPIRGGKFIIQAKRYTNVVPVSAVRDLYGTMISEGASKGILVTTSHFGSDSRKFVKDKPITLLDGSNLVYLLEKHGQRVKIDVAAAKANKHRNPFRR